MGTSALRLSSKLCLNSPRLSVLVTLFYLSSLLLWLHGQDRRERSRALIVYGVLAVLAFGAALLSKETAATLPLMGCVVWVLMGRGSAGATLRKHAPMLGALVAVLLRADALIMLTTAEGLLTKLPGAGGELRQLTHNNDELLAGIRLGEVEDVRFNSADGTEVEAFIIKPPSFNANMRYPTILWIHGGPMAQYDFGFSFQGWEFSQIQPERRLSG